MKETIIILGTCAVFFIVLVYASLFMASFKCKSAYEDYQPKWEIISGCRIVVDGKLTPVDIVRELN